MMNTGVTVIICPDCMKQYGVKAADLIDGVQIGKPGPRSEAFDSKHFLGIALRLQQLRTGNRSEEPVGFVEILGVLWCAIAI